MNKDKNDDEQLIRDKEIQMSPSKSGKGKILWKKVKYQLVEYHSLPAYLRDNEFILGYYRSEWPIKHILLSIFSLHNETLNVWTHLIGFFLFLSLTIYTATKVPDFSALINIIAPVTKTPITRWPFYTFLGGAMFCLLGSSICHLFSCHSEQMAYIMLRVDYTGIAALITTSFYPPVYYSFMCNPFFCRLYIGFISVLGVGAVLGSLLPVFQTPQFRNLRAMMYFGMGLSGVVPILHKVALFWNQPEALHTTGYEVLMGLLYGIGAAIYATRIPERWMPGRFDLAGHSHQLFHVFVVAGAYVHYRAGLVYLKWRDLEGC